MLYCGSSIDGCSTGGDDLIVFHREVTGFKFDMLSFCEYRNDDIPFRNRVFLEKIGNDVKIIDVLALIEDEDKFSKVSDEDAFQLCLLLSLDVIFMGRELVSVVDDVLLSMVDNLDAWNTFPWESSCESDRWWTKVPKLIPRAVTWTRKAEFFKLEYFGELFHKVITLKTNRVEKEESLNQFGPQIEDLLKSTSEDEPDIIDNRSKIVEKYVLMHDNPISQPIYEDFSFDLAVLNRFCNLSQNEDEKDNCEFLACLCGLDDSRQGWLVDEVAHPTIRYGLVHGWSNVERVFILINEPRRHWSLAMFHICSRIVTFYYSEKSNATRDNEFRPWYLKMRQCLEENIHVVLKETGVFENKNIDPTKYKISFTHADHVPKHGGVFGDCGVFLCMFLYRLAYVVSLVVDDPIQAALAYRET
nr:phospholipase-like protein [Tanacetum cinerariifolium]